MVTDAPLITLTDEQLVAHVSTAARDERGAIARLVAALAEFDRRKLYLAQGCSSLFTYCTNVLHLSEAATYNRTAAARAAARFPLVIAKLQDGSVSLTTVRLLAPVFTAGNHAALLERAAHQPTREVERLVASIRPRPDVPTSVRKLPERVTRSEVTARVIGSPVAPCESAVVPDSPGARQTGEPVPYGAPPALEAAADVPVNTRTAVALPRPVLAPLSADRYRIQFTGSRSLHDKLRRARDLLRHSVPDGDLGVIVERAVDLLIADIVKRKFAAVRRARSASPAASALSTTIPAAVRREVSQRDGAQCAFVGPAGRCKERAFLEFHHVWARVDDGPATVENIQLRCRAHNQYEADLLFPAEGSPDAESPRHPL